VGGVVSGPARALPLLGVVVYVVASALHGGEQADDLPASCRSTPRTSCGWSATPASCSAC
jgi:hypothetical protein